MRWAVLAAVPLWGGVSILLSLIPWFGRRDLTDRLRPFAWRSSPAPPPLGLLSGESFREVIGPLCRIAGERIARLLGVSESLTTRLQRLHSPLDVTAFRVRQIGAALAALGGAVVLAAGSGMVGALNPAVVTVVLGGAPCLAFLVVEHRLGTRSAAWQARVLHELPVVIEQLAMLLSAGFSLGAGLNRLGTRGHGAVTSDLGRVAQRIRHGAPLHDALKEWAAVAGLEAVDRVIAILLLNREAADLGRLLSVEARHIRTEAHRRTVEEMQRRAQAVWVPVTVATLVPGVIFLSVPFTQALRLFTVS